MTLNNDPFQSAILTTATPDVETGRAELCSPGVQTLGRGTSDELFGGLNDDFPAGYGGTPGTDEIYCVNFLALHNVDIFWVTADDFDFA